MSTRFNFFPCLKGRMGDWEYYVTRMRMGDVIEEVQFASEFRLQEDQVDALSHARQRVLSTSRVTGDIVKFLSLDSRFFSSIVVATIDGDPKFFPVKISAEVAVNVFEDSDEDQDFGFLRLDRNRKMYALDGQHRLAAINCMLDAKYRKTLGMKSGQGTLKIPAGFKDEHISVILVVRGKKEDNKNFHLRYRRLFSSLNRYAKKTDDITNIIMDEDDVYAILTRRLISEHPFFKDSSKSKESESTRVKMKKGDNLSPKEPQFIPLKILYQANRNLLRSKKRLSNLAPRAKEPWDLQSRPEDKELENLYKELSNYWDAIIGALPDLGKKPMSMRPSRGDGHLFFRPIGQKSLSVLVRKILDNSPALSEKSKVPDMRKRLAVLAKIKWDIQRSPWYGLVTVDGSTVGGKKTTKMRDPDREKVMGLVEDMVLCMVGDKAMRTTTGLNRLRERWGDLVLASFNKEKHWQKEVLPLLKGKRK